MNPNMMRKLQKMQRELMEAQEKLKSTVFSGSAGGGMVTVEVLGTKEVVKVSIDKDASLESDDLEMLEDTIVAALNDALRKVEKQEEEITGSVAGGLGGGIPGLF